jgi:hypothetical protein
MLNLVLVSEYKRISREKSVPKFTRKSCHLFINRYNRNLTKKNHTYNEPSSPSPETQPLYALPWRELRGENKAIALGMGIVAMGDARAFTLNISGAKAIQLRTDPKSAVSSLRKELQLYLSRAFKRLGLDYKASFVVHLEKGTDEKLHLHGIIRIPKDYRRGTLAYNMIRNAIKRVGMIAGEEWNERYSQLSVDALLTPGYEHRWIAYIIKHPLTTAKEFAPGLDTELPLFAATSDVKRHAKIVWEKEKARDA